MMRCHPSYKFSILKFSPRAARALRIALHGQQQHQSPVQGRMFTHWASCSHYDVLSLKFIRTDRECNLYLHAKCSPTLLTVDMSAYQGLALLKR